MSKIVIDTGNGGFQFPNGIEVDISLALQSVHIKDLVENFGGIDKLGGRIDLKSDQDNDSISRVFMYVDLASKNPVVNDDTERAKMAPWEIAFFDSISTKDLFNFILASNYLDIKTSLNASCKRVANMIKGKTPEEIRKTFEVV